MCPPPSLSHKLVLIYWAGFLLLFSLIGVTVSVASWSQLHQESDCNVER